MKLPPAAPAAEGCEAERGRLDQLGAELTKGLPEAGEIPRVRRDGDVNVAGELGPAVRDPRLAAHE